MLPAKTWKLRTQTLSFDGIPKLMAIVNVTPDSFSDGGNFLDPSKAIAYGLKLVSDGADILDIGGESTRPYSNPVDTEEELRRVVAVVAGLSEQTDVPISIDTSKAIVAKAAIEAGAEIINDVTGLTGDPLMVNVALETGAGVCAMHMQGTPQTMQDAPTYDDVVGDILKYLERRRDELMEAGIEREKICLDPGVGFGKTHEHNLELIRRCAAFHKLGCPVLIGHSRKGFLGKIIGDKEANRDSATLGLTLLMAQNFIQIVRVHEIANCRNALQAFAAGGGLFNTI